MAKPKAKARKTKRKEPSFAVFPTLAKIAAGSFGVEQFEDHLALAVEFDHVLSKAEKATIKKLYAGWCDRVVDESRRADDDGGESFERFDALFIGDKAAQGGASRFIAAGESSAWLVGELSKLRGVVRVAFGDPPEGGAPIATSTVDDTPPPEFTKLELVHEKTRMAALTFAISLYGAKPLQKSPQAVLACWQKFLAIVPPGKLTLWGTETTSPMNRKQVTTSTLALLDKWLAKGAPKREYLAFDIGDEPTYSDAPRWQFVVWSRFADKEDAHFVHLAMPFHVGLARADEMAELARELFATGAFRSGTAGPCWSAGCFSSWTAEGNGALHACRLATTYPAIDYQDTVDDSTAVGIDGIKGVGWLTLLDAKFAAAVGGKKALARVATVSDAGSGVMLRAGDTPTLEGVE
ncbi:MAG TPA: type VI immunity family protein, partial [Kofleriaceae bacterium]